MKQLLFACSFLLLFACNSQKNAIDSTVKQDTNYTFTYTKKSRGTYTTTEVSENGAFLIDKLTNEKTSLTLPPNVWDSLISIVRQINLSNIGNLKTPSDKRFSDRAPSAQLTVTYKDKSYTSIQFDHGNPPSELKDLVNQLVALTETKK